MGKRIYLVIAAVFLTATIVQGQIKVSGNEMHGHLAKGDELFEAGSYRAAQLEFVKAKDLAVTDNRAQVMRLDYLIAECAGKLGDRNAMDLLRAFITEYPDSAYDNDVRFAIANLLYLKGEYKEACDEYASVAKFELKTSQQDEYNFKLGHSLFIEDRLEEAYSSFQQVGYGSSYTPHARYYIAYIDYVKGNYAVAKREFVKLASDPSYEKIIPFYLLQIEFLEKNYNYVATNGDPILDAATGEREAEIARIIGESWFHLVDYAKTLKYMYRYREAGGRMGRSENYIVGYSQYMRNDISDATASLSLVAGPDDKLTQNAAYHLGGCYLRAGDKYKAMQSFSMAAGSDFDPAIKEDALFNYGKLQYELGGGVFNEAINILDRYIKEYPDSPRVGEAREYLVAAYYNSRNYEAAYEAIKLVKDPDNNMRTAYQKITYFRALDYYNAGDYDTAYRFLEESFRNKFNPKYTALTQFWKGEILFRKGEYKKAVPLFREYIALSPQSEYEHAIALYDLGYCFFNQSQWGESRVWFDKFLAAHRDNDGFRADALNRTGDARFAVREFKQALIDYDAAISIGTDERYYAEYQRAIIKGLISGRDSKIFALKVIIALGKGGYVPDAMYELGRTYLVGERFKDAAAVLKSFVNEYPDNGKNLAALSGLGLAYQNMGDNSSALKYYKELTAKAPASAEARDAMLAAKSIYVEMNDVDGYFDFAKASGVETDMGIMERDSLSFAAAERVYMGASSKQSTIVSVFQDYLNKFPRGAYRSNALYIISEQYIAMSEYDKAISSLKELADMHYNTFTVRGLEKLAPLCYERKRYDEAATAYRKLASTAVNPETKGVAFAGYLKSVKAEGDDKKILSVANEIIEASPVPVSVLKDAKFTKANVLYRAGDNGAAIAIFKDLAVESQSAEGAESTYRVIKWYYDNGDYEQAEKLILKLAGQNTPHSYWLGKAFLTLGDIYVKKGDKFQARATLQSVVDVYLPLNDGIVDEAKEKISKLGD